MRVGRALSVSEWPYSTPRWGAVACSRGPGRAGRPGAGVTAFYEMNEPAGTTVMTGQRPGNGSTAPVDPTGVSPASTFDGATGYNWVHRPPEQAPPSPERVIQVPDNTNLEPGNRPFTIELRYRTQENFGNITQKGQAPDPGRPVEDPGTRRHPVVPVQGLGWPGRDRCEDAAQRRAVAQPHLRAHLDRRDDVRRRRLPEPQERPAGTINNSFPMTVGGKINCDQIDITCDYFSGRIDFLKITKAANQLPDGCLHELNCFGLTCTFDSSSAG